MVIPPLDLRGRNPRASRRMTYILRDYWDEIRGERQFPSESDVKPSELTDIWDNCFVVEANNSSRREDYKYSYVGKNIISAYGKDLTGLKPGALVAPDARLMEQTYEKVLALKRPVFDSGSLVNARGQEIKYRQILLPLGDGVNISAIIGGMSYRVVH